MKIAIIVPGFSAHEQDWCIPALLDFVRVLAKLVDVHVFTLRWPERESLYSVYGATVHALGGQKHLGLRGSSLLYLRAMRAIAREHYRAPFTALHAFWADEPGWVTSWVGQWLKIPIIISLAGGELVGFRDIGYGAQLLPGRNLLIQTSLRSAKWITAGSNYLLGIAQSHIVLVGKRKLLFAPLGVDTNRFSPSREKQRGKSILNVGSLYPIKNQSLLLRAMARLPHFQLDVVGIGPLAAGLARLASTLGISERVKFLGEIDHGAMPAVYHSVQAFVQSSRHEAQGMAVLEAAACGIISLGTSVGVLPELGIQAHDEADFVQHLDAILRDEDYRRMIGEEARAKVLADFTLDRSVERFMNLYGS